MKILSKEKDSKNINRLIIFVLIILLLILAMYFIVYHKFLISGKQYNNSISSENMSKITGKLQDIKQGTIVEKTFTASKNNLEKIIVSFAKNESIITTTIDVNIKLEDITNKKIIKEDTVSYNMIRIDNDYDFVFDTQKDSKGKQYKLTIIFNKIGKSDLSILYSEKKLQNDSVISVDGEETSGTLAINECYVSNSRILKFNIISLLLSGFIAGLSIFIYTRKNLVPEKLFLYTVPIICLMFLIVMPMYRGHDEIRHLLRVYEISEGNLLTQINGDTVGTQMPKSIIDGVGKNWREAFTYKDLINMKDRKLESTDTEVANMETVAIYSPIQYMPQSVGMIVAKLFTDNVLVILYAARLFNLIVCVSLLYLAIKIIPFGKMLIYIISLLPLSIEAFATMSPDGITISVVLLFVAYILNITFNKEKTVNKKDIVVISILSIIIALCKIVYVPLVGLILIIPSNKYKNKKEKTIVSIFILLISIIINLIWLKISTNYLEITSDGSSTEKVKNILMAPITYLRTILYTINYSGDKYVQSLFGSVLEMGEFVKLYFVVPFVYLILFLFESVTDSDLKNKFSKFQNIVMLFIVVVIIGLVFTSLYVQYTAENSMVIQGVQGRYFIPILFIIGLLLSNLKIVNHYDKERKMKLIGVVSVILQIYIILSIMIAHI